MGNIGGKKREKKEPAASMSKSIEEKKKGKLYEIKVIILGDAGVGKTSLFQKYCENKYEDKYIINIGGAYRQKEEKLENGDILKLHIWNIGGQEKFRSMLSLYLKDAVAAILVYDVSNKESFESLDYWVKEINDNVDNNNFIISLAGNKCDLPNEIKTISYNDGKNFCIEKEIPIFYEISAKTGDRIKDLFSSLAQKVYEAQRNEEK